MPERVVRPGILTSDTINALSWAEESFYRRLMSVVDDYGRFDGRDSVLRANLYPLKLDHVSDSDVRKWKAGCADAGAVRLYSVDSKPYIEILKFDQRMRGKKKWPEPPQDEPTRGDSPQHAATRGDLPPSSETETETGAQVSRGDSPPVGGPHRARPTTGAIGAFGRAWEARYGAAPSPSKGDVIAANQALKAFSEAERVAIVEAYVADSDPWIVDKAHRLGLLPGQLDRIRAGVAKKGRARNGSAPPLDEESNARKLRAAQEAGMRPAPRVLGEEGP